MGALRKGFLSALLGSALAAAAWAATIQPGEVRVVEGRIAAVDVAYRSVVLEVPTPKGDLTVGVTLDEGVEPRTDGQPLALGNLQPGDTARLKYTRRDDRLVGLDLAVRR
ncbi:MAG: hypothetical protein D6708_06700 [Candidatus Dadabacteria bacterium]|nr:MAG: hypothetical protein D6708_06700 [Candidatus Dadabacteria bacterium]